MRELSPEIARIAENAISERVFPGCVIGMVRANGPSTLLRTSERKIWSFGRLTYGENASEVTEDTIYDLASITKSIPVASLAAMLMAEGRLRPADAVRRYLPELQNDRGATIEDLLRYRVRGPRLSMLAGKSPDEILAHVFDKGFDGLLSTRAYTNLPALFLGVILERIGSASLDSLAHERFFVPLKMQTATYFPKNSSAIYRAIAPTEMDRSGEVRGLPHDESARVFATAKRAVGHAGLFSNAADLLRFLEALLTGRLPAVADGAQKGLGWQVNDKNFMGAHTGETTFGKTGFTGTSIVCDIARGVGFVILSNRTYPKRPADFSAINAFRCALADAIFESA